MASLQEPSRVLLEIALDIGRSLDLPEMLQRSLRTILRKLDCLAALILADRCDAERVWLEQVFAARDTVEPALANALATPDIAPSSPPGTGRTDWNEPKPRPSGDAYHYLLDLPGYGALVLFTPRPMDPLLARALQPLCHKLAESCIACEVASALKGGREDLRARLYILEEHERRLREAQQMARLGNWSWDVNTGEVEWSEEVYGIFRLDPREFTPQIDSILALSPWPEDHQRDKELMQKSIDTRQPGSYEQRFLRPDGSTGYYASTYEGQYDENGDLVRMVGTVQDITERKLAEEALRESEERLSAFMNSATDAFTIWDADLNLLDLNQTAMTYLPPGMSKADVLGFNITKLVPNVVETGHYQQYLDVIRTGHPVSFEDYLLFEGFGDKVLNVRAFKVGDGLGIVTTDITELKRAEEALRRQQEFTETALDSQQDTFFLFDPAIGKAIRWNQAFTEISGYSDDEIAGMKAPDSYYSPEDLGRAGAFVQEVLNTGSGTIELELLCKDGHKVPTEYKVSVVKDEDGEPRYIISIGRDVTDRRREDEERRKLEEQLRQAQKMEAVGQLTGGVAHDFNNLLQVINGATELAMQDIGASHPAHESLAEVAKAGQRAAELVSQLLLFSRRQIMRPAILDLNAVIADLLKMLDRVIGEHVQLQWHPASRVGTIHADRGMVEQALMNLCVNARDAMPDGGTLIIETHEVVVDDAYGAMHSWARAGRYALLSVADTGCGIDKEELDHIFEPFYTTKQTGKGTGLGLATVYGIVKQHDGMVNVYSKPGKGTVFKLYWPVSGAAVEAADDAPNIAARGGIETILVAEDDDMVRRLARTILERAGYTVLTANNGAEAATVFEERGTEIDMAILDVVMPRMGGREAYDRMCALRPGLKALFASGYSENAIHTNFVLDKGLALIQKPFAPDALLRAVREILDGNPKGSVENP